MEAQLRLIAGSQRGTRTTDRTPRPSRARTERREWHARWALDAETRRRGLEGVARARRALEGGRAGDEGHRRAS